MNLLRIKNIFNVDFLEKYGIVLILIFFGAITITGIFQNYSIPNTVGDETILMAATLKMIAEKSLRPDYPTMYHMPFGVYIYLPFFILLLVFLRLSGLFTSIEEIKAFGIVYFEKLLPMARFISVLLGMACVYLIYKICQKLFNNKFISLFASFLLATNLIFVQLSHFGKVWLPQIFIIILAFYFIAALYQKEKFKFKDYFYAAFLTGVSFGTHFIGILVYLPFLVVHYLKNKEKSFKEIFAVNKNFWLSNLVIIFLLFSAYYFNPYGFKNYGAHSLTAAVSIFNENAAEAGGKNDFWQAAVYFGKILFENGQALTVIFVLSLIPFFLKRRNLFFILNSFIFGYYIVIGPVIGPTFGIRGRGIYTAPIVPFMAIISAYGIHYFYQNNFVSRKIKVFLLAALFLYSLYLPILWDYKLIQPSTWVLAQKWIYDNLPPGAKIINLNMAILINENKESLEDAKAHTPNFFTKRQQYLLSSGNDEYPKPNYYVLTPPNYRDGIPKEILGKDFDYLVASWFDQARYVKSMQGASQFNLKEENLIKIFPAGAASSTFIMDLEGIRRPFYNLRKMDYVGPVIAIYKLKK